MCLDRLFFLDVLATGCIVLANMEERQVAGDLVPPDAPDNSCCWVFVYVSNALASSSPRFQIIDFKFYNIHKLQNSAGYPKILVILTELEELM